MDKRGVGIPSEAEIHARAAERRALRSVDPADILKQGYKPEEVQTVILFRKKRDEWRKMSPGDSIDVLVNTELKSWLARFDEDFAKKFYAAQKKGTELPPTHSSFYRGVRAVIGSSLENEKAEVPVPFEQEFDLPGEFSIEKNFIPHVEHAIEEKLKSRTSEFAA